MKHDKRQFDDDQPTEPELSSAESEEAEDAEYRQEKEEVVPGVPIVRSNTPRPLSFEALMSSGGRQGLFEDSAPFPAFPAKAPSAPPVPEELADNADDTAIDTRTHNTPIPLEQVKPAEEQQEFIWLFEYGLEMDKSILNSPERLAGRALLYGPAVLKGYRMVLGMQQIHGNAGQTIVAIEPSLEVGAEVWGVLYRIPRRVAEASEDEPSLLDTIHAAMAPQKFFKGIEVVVYETYREREVSGLTYVATDVASQQLHLLPLEKWHGDDTCIRRLMTIARKQKLPESYIERLENLLRPRQADDNELRNSSSSSSSREHISIHNSSMGHYDMQSTKIASSHGSHMTGISSARISAVHASQMASHSVMPFPAPDTEIGPVQDEHNTEPLPTFGERPLPATELVPRSMISQLEVTTHRWLLAFALYLVFLLLVALIFAIIQGLGVWGDSLAGGFMPLGVPWLVMMYGLLGGCISSIVTLGRFRANCPPAFIIITWFTRPFIGSILAVLSYELLTSGIFSLSRSMGQHSALCFLVGALAGLMEGLVFFKRVHLR